MALVFDIPCPYCDKKLKLRTNRKTGNKFLGCSGYPDCDYTQELSLDQLKRAQGDPELDLFVGPDERTPAALPETKKCRSCGAPIQWGFTAKEGKRAPFDVDATGRATQVNHFVTCPQRKEWRKK